MQGALFEVTCLPLKSAPPWPTSGGVSICSWLCLYDIVDTYPASYVCSQYETQILSCDEYRLHRPLLLPWLLRLVE